MKERPILFNGAMVRASLDGSKTQTRRVAKDVKHPDWGNLYAPSVLAREPQHVINRACPYGKPGDRLWVRETWSADAFEVSYKERVGEWVKYFGPDHEHALDLQKMYDRQRDQWRPSIHMPRWASRIMLEVTDVRVERLMRISEEDAIAEGAKRNDAPGEEWDGSYLTQRYLDGIEGSQNDEPHGSAKEWFRDLWKQINGPKSWEENPWVWVVEFQLVKGGQAYV